MSRDGHIPGQRVVSGREMDRKLRALRAEARGENGRGGGGCLLTLMCLPLLATLAPVRALRARRERKRRQRELIERFRRTDFPAQESGPGRGPGPVTDSTRKGAVMTEPTVANEQRMRQIAAFRALSDLYGHHRPTPLVWEIHPDGSLSGRAGAELGHPARVVAEYMRLIGAETAEADGGVITARGTWMGHAVTITAVVPYPDEEEAA